MPVCADSWVSLHGQSLHDFPHLPQEVLFYGHLPSKGLEWPALGSFSLISSWGPWEGSEALWGRGRGRWSLESSWNFWIRRKVFLGLKSTLLHLWLKSLFFLNTELRQILDKSECT